MPLENIGLTVSAIGCILGILLIIFGVSFFLIENNNKVMLAKAARTIGIGVLTITASIPFSIPNHLLAESTSDGTSILGVIILSVFLGSPLLFMGLACYIGLNEKASQILNSSTAQEKIRYYSPIQKKKIL
ncbi:hypothetical protein [Oceanobacillus chungangensis]|uniref:Uncharacterized protein n=1 Tax=Oceanobacillus chungangensis TaxID=1229152 RepID=A0A3D8PXS8_9BACI|nr:hypothetical protein [Oceanobacillus chungangensis]RDW19695.1 hypothetical protein CWR45_06345 [Oceanobacillus chungangensis]